MTIQDWGAIGELISAVAIFITLIYLAVQVKYARISATDASRANRVTGIHQISAKFIVNPEMRQAWLKAAGPGQTQLYEEMSAELGITFDEAAVVSTTGADWAWLHWAQFRSVKTLEDEAELRNIIAVWYSENPMKALMSHHSFRSHFDGAFLEFVDEIVGNGK
jgi:heme/copper-type cytochrome/quinol oxidase subunit 2